MRHSLVLAGTLCVALACSSDTRPTAPLSVAIYRQASQSGNANGGNFGTPMRPEEEVMPAGIVNTSQAVGNAVFHLSDDGTELSYKLIVANIDNVFMAHIHRAAAGTNGGIVVWLYPSTAPGITAPLGQGRLQGVIAEGTITAANLVGSLAGHPLSDLLALLETGGAYVNAHTNDGVGAVNTGPGDFPGGEIRGQVEARGNTK